MTKRATKDEQELRVQEACTMLSTKIPPSHIVRHMAEKHDISLQQARDYVRQAKGLLLEAFDLEDVKWQYMSIMESLQEDRLDAREQRKNQGESLKKFESSGNDVVGGGMGLSAFDPR